MAISNSSIFFIPASGSNIEWFGHDEYKLTQPFEAGSREQNKKWANCLLREVSKKIETLEELTDVIVNMVELTFQML